MTATRLPVEPPPGGDVAGLSEASAYFAERRAMIDPFVARHFTWPGTLRLHSAALGWDLLRAPLNVVLSVVLVLTRIAGMLCRWVGLRAMARWLADRRILLPTAVSRRVEGLIATDLLGLPLPKGAAGHDAAALAGRKVSNAIAEYAGTRSAVAEMTTGLLTLTLGAVAFRALTPGMISLAPGVADAVARSKAVAAFPLGQTMGGLWYGMFPTGASPLLFAASVVILVLMGSVLAAFAGVLADPVQSVLGIHRRRLMRLIVTLEVALSGPGDRPFTAREHYYARLLDLWDILGSALRLFRN